MQRLVALALVVVLILAGMLAPGCSSTDTHNANSKTAPPSTTIPKGTH